MVVTKEQIDRIEECNKKQNEGKGFICVGYIINWLRKNDLPMARRIFSIDGDKMTQYPDIYILIADTIGCRLHGTKNCQNALCKPVYDELVKWCNFSQS
jgi:hypothetical protein